MIDAEHRHFLNNHSPDNGLAKLTLEDIQKSGLSAKTLEKAQVRLFRGDKDTLKGRLGFASINGQSILSTSKLIEFPYFDKGGDILLYRYKLIPSTVDKDGREIKYLHPKEKPAIPYILPEVWKIKDKANKPVWITEGEKKALALLQYGRSAIALSGVWNFKAGGKSDLNNDKGLWQELHSFEWRGRTVYLAFDMDLWTNPSVRSALYELAVKLYERGALIKVVKW